VGCNTSFSEERIPVPIKDILDYCVQSNKSMKFISTVPPDPPSQIQKTICPRDLIPTQKIIQQKHSCFKLFLPDCTMDEMPKHLNY